MCVSKTLSFSCCCVAVRLDNVTGDLFGMIMSKKHDDEGKKTRDEYA